MPAAARHREILTPRRVLFVLAVGGAVGWLLAAEERDPVGESGGLGAQPVQRGGPVIPDSGAHKGPGVLD